MLMGKYARLITELILGEKRSKMYLIAHSDNYLSVTG